jgi:hypothetical protein
MILAQSTDIAASPERVHAFFEAMEENYTRWHPDHIVFRWLEPGRRVDEDSAFYIEERINGQLLKRAMRFTRVEPARHLEFAPDNGLIRFFLRSIVFAIEPTEAGCRLIQSLHIRIGPIGHWLNRRGFAAVEKHMREEGENMKAILEAGPRSLAAGQPLV